MYTLNLERSAVGILEAVGLLDTSKVPRSLPWRHIPSSGQRLNEVGSRVHGGGGEGCQKCTIGQRTSSSGHKGCSIESSAAALDTLHTGLVFCSVPLHLAACPGCTTQFRTVKHQS